MSASAPSAPRSPGTHRKYMCSTKSSPSEPKKRKFVPRRQTCAPRHAAFPRASRRPRRPSRRSSRRHALLPSRRSTCSCSTGAAATESRAPSPPSPRSSPSCTRASPAASACTNPTHRGYPPSRHCVWLRPAKRTTRKWCALHAGARAFPFAASARERSARRTSRVQSDEKLRRTHRQNAHGSSRSSSSERHAKRGRAPRYLPPPHGTNAEPADDTMGRTHARAGERTHSPTLWVQCPCAVCCCSCRCSCGRVVTAVSSCRSGHLVRSGGGRAEEVRPCDDGRGGGGVGVGVEGVVGHPGPRQRRVLRGSKRRRRKMMRSSEMERGRGLG